MTNLEQAARALAGMYYTDVDATHEVDKFKREGERRKRWEIYKPAGAAILTAFGIDPGADFVAP